MSHKREVICPRCQHHMQSKAITGRTRCRICKQSFIFDHKLSKIYNQTKNPRKLVHCPRCNREVKTQAKSGRTQCVTCNKPFIFDHDKFIEHTREYTRRPEVYKRRKEWEKKNRKHRAKMAMERYWKKHDHVRRLNNKACERLRGVSAISLDGSCEICHQQRKRMARHHILPMYAGGKDEKENLIRLCTSCHMKVEKGIRCELAIAEPLLYIYINQKIIGELKSDQTNRLP